MACKKLSKAYSGELVIKQIAPRLAVVSDDEYVSFLVGLTLLSLCQDDNTFLWISTFISNFSSKQDLKIIIKELPNLPEKFTKIVGSIVKTNSSIIVLDKNIGHDSKSY